jgi:hypothetical protein
MASGIAKRLRWLEYRAAMARPGAGSGSGGGGTGMTVTSTLNDANGQTTTIDVPIPDNTLQTFLIQTDWRRTDTLNGDAYYAELPVTIQRATTLNADAPKFLSHLGTPLAINVNFEGDGGNYGNGTLTNAFLASIFGNNLRLTLLGPAAGAGKVITCKTLIVTQNTNP